MGDAKAEQSLKGTHYEPGIDWRTKVWRYADKLHGPNGVPPGYCKTIGTGICGVTLDERVIKATYLRDRTQQSLADATATCRELLARNTEGAGFDSYRDKDTPAGWRDVTRRVITRTCELNAADWFLILTKGYTDE